MFSGDVLFYLFGGLYKQGPVDMSLPSWLSMWARQVSLPSATSHAAWVKTAPPKKRLQGKLETLGRFMLFVLFLFDSRCLFQQGHVKKPWEVKLCQ